MAFDPLLCVSDGETLKGPFSAVSRKEFQMVYSIAQSPTRSVCLCIPNHEILFTLYEKPPRKPSLKLERPGGRSDSQARRANVGPPLLALRLSTKVFRSDSIFKCKFQDLLRAHREKLLASREVAPECSVVKGCRAIVVLASSQHFFFNPDTCTATIERTTHCTSQQNSGSTNEREPTLVESEKPGNFS